MKDTISKSVIDRTRAKLGLTGNLRARTNPSAKRKAAAPTATASPGKTSFVKEFLHDHPDANTAEVNKAWTASGMKGSISRTLVNKTRIKVTGKGLAQTRTAVAKQKSVPQAKSRVSKPAEVAPTPNKTRFVRDFLSHDPQGNTAAINEAWAEDGMTGTISSALVNKTRADLGLSGNLRGKRRKGRPSNVVVQPRGRKSSRTTVLMTVEEEIDRLIFSVMGIGELPEVEATLREARRAVYRAMSS
jgi:hypothetical protein